MDGYIHRTMTPCVRVDARPTTTWFARCHVFHSHLFVRIKSAFASGLLTTSSLWVTAHAPPAFMLIITSVMGGDGGATPALDDRQVQPSARSYRATLLACGGNTTTLPTRIHCHCNCAVYA